MDTKTVTMRSLAIEALTWVVYAARPLSLDELVEAVAIDKSIGYPKGRGPVIKSKTSSTRVSTYRKL